ncbi:MULTISPECIES: flagellar hook capping FlgD N-terminal domain-containing protein [Bacillus]|uniref:flagellar hook capping FlgD N-terminal domain-containing protein n=1 Tax=Bacillus TaxID=1386 RepID=UPI0022E0D113|nr:flagellar hook capping FlgD N-terminal domain-containing protein [Bacillus smithii]
MGNTIDPSLYLPTTNNQSNTNGKDNSILGKDDFLKLLMAEMQNQDPLSPMDNNEMIGQMAQFSTLEQITNLASSLEKLLNMEQQNQYIAYSSFVGKNVTYHKLEDSDDPNGDPVVQEGHGVVSSVRFTGDSVEFVLTDGTVLEPANISEIQASSETPSTDKT